MSSHRLTVCFPLLLLFAALAYVMSEAGPATCRWPPRIQFGVTPIRIKHKADGLYMTVVPGSYWPTATLGESNLFYYVLYVTFDGVKVKTLNSTHPGHDYLSGTESRELLFELDGKYQIVTMPYQPERYRYRELYWRLGGVPSFPPNEFDYLLYDGDVVTFNRRFGVCSINYDEGAPSGSVNLFCLLNRADEWILEVV